MSVLAVVEQESQVYEAAYLLEINFFLQKLRKVEAIGLSILPFVCDRTFFVCRSLLLLLLTLVAKIEMIT